jgi:hypothetical protein
MHQVIKFSYLEIDTLACLPSNPELKKQLIPQDIDKTPTTLVKDESAEDEADDTE